MKTIVFPTDFSQSADHALAWAQLLARHYNATLQVMHVFSPLLPVVPPPGMAGPLLATPESEAEANSRNQLEALANQLRTDGFVVQTSWQTGNVDDQILAAAHHTNADLIVTGRSDMHSFLDRLAGTHASGVAKNAHCPVLIVPTTVPEGSVQLQTIAYATQLEGDDDATIRAILELARDFKAKLDLIHVEAENQPNVFDDNAVLTGLRHTFGTDAFRLHTIKSRTVSGGLADFLEKHPIDLLVMTTRKRDFLDGLLKPSITSRMITHTQLPTLIYHD
ncbi:universal stress protein [Spirosoma sp. SC4-14]|uniref:universal stress protein n=1 Tax=Spirosoma sp. SC4-14 TaxID=3128900 RepID=UPI0030CA8BBA